VGLVLLVTVGWPILYLLGGYPDYPWGLTLASVLPAFGILLSGMIHPMKIDDTVWWAGYWDVILLLTAIIASGLAIRALDRRSRGSPGDAGPPGPDAGSWVDTGPEAGTDPVFAEHPTRLPMGTP
jgi:hypothetical protein